MTDTAAFGVQSMIAPLQRVLLKHARSAYRDPSTVAGGWRPLGYAGPPAIEEAVRQYDAFVELISREVAAIEFLDVDACTSLDSIYAYDPVIVTEGGAILCRMGKPLRGSEPEITGAYLEAAGIPTLGRIEPPGTLEAGDVVWLDRRTVAVGRGYRTNDEGISQLRQLLAPHIDELIVVPLPHWNGPAACLHLMSLISLVDTDLAVTYSRALPVFMREWLLGHGYSLLDVEDAEHRTLACNVLALAPRRCMMVAGNPVTRRLLEQAGATVIEYDGSEISLKGTGGPTCLTRPLLRA
ncbi:MAG: amidinotransferase [Acidobacteria bacterium]|nr:amidinotransferase [Acidobacteriota bacterium]